MIAHGFPVGSSQAQQYVFDFFDDSSVNYSLFDPAAASHNAPIDNAATAPPEK